MPNSSDSDQPANPPEVLDLLGGQKKLSRRERQRLSAEPPPPEPEEPSALEVAKQEALDLLGSPRKSRPSRDPKDVLPTISKLLDQSDEAEVAAAPEDEPAAAAEPVTEPATAADEAPAEETPAAGSEATAADDDEEDDASDEPGLIVIKPPILVNDLAARMGLKPYEIMADLIKLAVFPAPNQPIDTEVAGKICEMHGFTFQREKRKRAESVVKPAEPVVEPPPPAVVPKDALRLRPPIVTIMGHVDHGKTTVLDFFRKSRVAVGEAGGITQHIGAYQVVHNGQPITFLDTPGHAIFSDMRARGAAITDIVVIVIAANDGIMPQTMEAIEHAKQADKAVIVAINKCDLSAANPDRVKTQLAEQGLQTTDYGGDTEFALVSAINGEGMNDLLDLIVLQAEVMELKANPKGTARARVIEARVEQGRGTTASVIVESGTLKMGMPFICGPYSGKVRTMVNDHGERVKTATPGMPVEVVGFEELPNVGDHLTEMKTERAAKALASERQEEERLARLKPQHRSRMEDLFAMVNEGGGKAQLKIILKCDVQGSVEAIKKAVLAIESEKVECLFITSAVGPVSETDVQYADTADAVIIGFNVKVEAKAVKAAKAVDIQVKLFSVVYELIDQVREAMLGLLEPLTRENIIGHAEVRKVFRLSRGRAAGCFVADGRIHRKAHARVIRDGVPVFDGRMSTLRRFQEEVEEVRQAYECGIRLGEFNEYQEGDVIECYKLEKIPQTL